jgi:hypothetical protein
MGAHISIQCVNFGSQRNFQDETRLIIYSSHAFLNHLELVLSYIFVLESFRGLYFINKRSCFETQSIFSIFVTKVLDQLGSNNFSIVIMMVFQYTSDSGQRLLK